jgi:hypothetical protein
MTKVGGSFSQFSQVFKLSSNVNSGTITTLTTVVLQIILKPNIGFVSNQAVRGIVLTTMIPSIVGDAATTQIPKIRTNQEAEPRQQERP